MCKFSLISRPDLDYYVLTTLYREIQNILQI